MSDFDTDLDDLLTGKRTLDEILSSNSTLKETKMESTGSDKTHYFAGPKATIFMGNKLGEVCSITAEGLARYQPGWSDERVLEFVNKGGFPAITLGHIHRLRKNLFGPLFKPGANGVSTGSANRSRVTKLEAQMEEVMAYLTSKNPHWKDQI